MVHEVLAEIEAEKDNKFENFALLKNVVNFKEITWIIRIHFFPVRIQDSDPDPHQNKMDPKHCLYETAVVVQTANVKIRIRSIF